MLIIRVFLPLGYIYKKKEKTYDPRVRKEKIKVINTVWTERNSLFSLSYEGPKKIKKQTFLFLKFNAYLL
jgi:hypothetical protein